MNLKYYSASIEYVCLIHAVSGTENTVEKRQVLTLRELTLGEQTAEHAVQCDKCFEGGRTEKITEERLLNQPGESEEALQGRQGLS